MTACRDVLAFLNAVQARNVPTALPAEDLATLSRLTLVQTLTPDQYAALTQEVQGLASLRDEIARDGAEHARVAAALEQEYRHTHSILFHLERAEKQRAEEGQVESDRARLQAVGTDLTSHEQAFAQLVAKKALADAATAFPGGYVALTGLGAVAIRDLGVRLYRVGDVDFAAYWAQSQQVDRDLNDLADASRTYFSGIARSLPDVDPTYLWAIGIGLAKTGGPAEERLPAFLAAYQRVRSISTNLENSLLSAEILASVRTPIDSALPDLARLDADVRDAGVPSESSLGVAAILLLGRRADGTYATSNLGAALPFTRSYESAALLAVVNEPFADLQAKFLAARARFLGWGFQPSEDVELASAYLAVSDLPLDGIATKLAIIARGLGTYLQYPLVAAAILASIPVLEANETLALLEAAYDLLGRRTGPLPQAGLVCLAVRLIHGVKVASVDQLDPTAAARASPVSFSYGAVSPRFFLPVIVTHGFYYSTFSGFGGAHPGHIHAFGGGFTG